MSILVVEDAEDKSIYLTDTGLVLLGGGVPCQKCGGTSFIDILQASIFLVRSMQVQFSSETHNELAYTSSQPPL